jgi:hypothetical protein
LEVKLNFKKARIRRLDFFSALSYFRDMELLAKLA